MPLVQHAFINPGTYAFAIPLDLIGTTVKLECVSAGEGGTRQLGGRGGGYSTRTVSVTPGETLTVIVGAGGVGKNTLPRNVGQNSLVNRGSTILVGAFGGGTGGGATGVGTPFTIGNSTVEANPDLGYDGGNNGGDGGGTRPIGGAGGGGGATSAGNGTAGTNGRGNPGAAAGVGGANGGGNGGFTSPQQVGYPGIDGTGGGGGGGLLATGPEVDHYGGNGGHGRVTLTYEVPACPPNPPTEEKYGYGEFGSVCCSIDCCASGMLDIYAPARDPGRWSSEYFFSRSASTNPKAYPDTGYEMEKQWGYRRQGVHARRQILRSKAAWPLTGTNPNNRVVYELESSNPPYSSSSTPIDIGDSFLRQTSVDSLLLHLHDQSAPNETSLNRVVGLDWTVHSGSFIVQADRWAWSYRGRATQFPLYGLVSSSTNNLASIPTDYSDLFTVQGLFVIDSDFEACSVAFRVSDPRNYMRATLREYTGTGLFSIESVVDGIVSILASQPVTESGVFLDGNAIGTAFSLATYQSLQLFKAILVTVSSSTITARLTTNYLDELTGTDVDISLTGTSSLFNTSKRVGVWAETAGVGCQSLAWGTTQKKHYLSVYDDSVPTQLAEFDVDSILLPQRAVSPGGNRFGTLIAGHEKGLWIYETGTGFSAKAGINQTALADVVSDSLDGEGSFYTATFSAGLLEIINSGGTWSVMDRTGYREQDRTYYMTGTSGEFQSNPFRLGYKALPVFAQHSYPKCAGYRFDVGTAAGTGGAGFYNIDVEHQIVAGEVVWPNGTGTADGFPYVNYQEGITGTLLFSHTENLLNRFVATNATEDAIRLEVTPIFPSSPGFNAGGWIMPLRYFEADPDLSACAIGFNWDLVNNSFIINKPFYQRVNNRMGVVRLQPTGTGAQQFNWNHSPDHTPSAVAAPDARVAVTGVLLTTDPVIDFDPFDYAANVIGIRLVIYGPSVTGDPWIRFVYDETGTNKRFVGTPKGLVSLRAASDQFVYLETRSMLQPEMKDFAGAEMPEIQVDNAFFDDIVQPDWLLSWDGQLRIPCLTKMVRDSHYRHKKTFHYAGFFTNGAGRFTQAFDCIKDGSLVYAPQFSLTGTQTGTFIEDYTYVWQLYPAGIAEGAGTGIAKPNATGTFFVECWGGGGGGAGGYGQADGFGTSTGTTGTSGNGGGGGGGYAAGYFPSGTSDYLFRLGTGGYGQTGTPGGLTYVPLLHGANTWFSSPTILQAAGGNSAGNLASPNNEIVLSPGALGGGLSGAANLSVGEITWPGGSGGNGCTLADLFPWVGGGGGSAGCTDGAGRDGVHGKDGGWGGEAILEGNSVFNTSDIFASGGAHGSDDGIENQVHIFGQTPGAGGGGALADPTSPAIKQNTTGGHGKIRITGQRETRYIQPEF